MPEAPKEETSFLTFPKTGNHVVDGKLIGRMRPHVMIFVAVVINEVEKGGNDANYTKNMQGKGTDAHAFPTGFLKG